MFAFPKLHSKLYLVSYSRLIVLISADQIMSMFLISLWPVWKIRVVDKFWDYLREKSNLLNMFPYTSWYGVFFFRWLILLFYRFYFILWKPLVSNILLELFLPSIHQFFIPFSFIFLTTLFLPSTFVFELQDFS